MATQVVLCRCEHGQVLDSGAVARVVRALAASGFDVCEVPDLCGACADGDTDVLERLAEGALVIACHERAVEWLLAWRGVQGVRCIDLRGGSAADAVAACGVTCEVGSSAEQREPDAPAAPSPAWVPWFPVIDYARCSGCRQCLSFCPFGVYHWEEGRVVVATPHNCKNNCPACARLCPEVAIMFPKLADRPINGDVVQPEDIARVQRALAEQGGDEGLHEILARRKLRAAYRKLERQAASEGRVLTSDELEQAMAGSGAKETHA